MDRRFITWLLISFALFFLLAKRPKPKPKKPVEDAAVQALKQGEGPQAQGQQVAKDDGQAEDPDGQPDEDAAPDADQEQEIDSQLVSLGSVDESSPYRMLATLTNEGAAVTRIELANPRYLDLQQRHGYLGHLALTPAEAGGLLVRVLGAGTPAQQAGLQPEDRLLAGGTKEMTEFANLEAFEKSLTKTKPGQTYKLKIARGDQQMEFEAKLVRRPLEVIRPESENVSLWTKKVAANLKEPPSFQMTLGQLGERTLAKLRAELQAKLEKELIEAGTSTNTAAKLAEKQAAERMRELPNVKMLEAAWEVTDRSIDSVTFAKSLAGGLTVKKRYTLEQVPDDLKASADYPAYGLTLQVTFENTGDKPSKLAYQLDGPNGLPIEGWWYANKIGHGWGAVGLRDVMSRTFAGDVQQFGASAVSDPDEELEKLEGGSFAYLGVDAQYFSVMMVPVKQDADDRWLAQAELRSLSPPPRERTSEGRYANVTCRLTSRATTLEPGDQVDHTYRIFAGPKRPELVSQYKALDSPGYSLADLITYGWFSRIAKAMLWVLHFFYGLVGNYGVAIILLTVLVRSCLFPLSRKQAQSMAKMQELKPEMDRIKEKYKTDMQKQSQMMQQLYRKHGVNPLAGCLPMVIQLPVFVGLYRGLAVDVELRQAPLLGEGIHWCSNLAAPDMLWDWSAYMPEFVNRGDGIFSPGPYLNILPLVTVALFLLQQKMFMPEPANEQAALQQKIMKYMMVFMGLMFYKVPSGLCLYFIASSLWGICERKLLPKPTTPDANDDGSGSDDDGNPYASQINKPKAPSESRVNAAKKAAKKRNQQRGKGSGKSKRKR